jgi:branched-chain amino acid transport system substrate-binding protein
MARFSAPRVTGDPTYSEYIGYLSVDALVQGLKGAGTNPTQAGLINTMLGMTKYSGAGLYGGHVVNFSLSGRGADAGPDNCGWITQFSGTTFHLVAGMDPICGQVIPGESVSSSS